MLIPFKGIKETKHSQHQQSAISLIYEFLFTSDAEEDKADARYT